MEILISDRQHTGFWPIKMSRDFVRHLALPAHSTSKIKFKISKRARKGLRDTKFKLGTEYFKGP